MPDAAECAHGLMDVVPEFMQHIRTYVRGQRGADLSVVQLRSLLYVKRNPGTALSDVADYVGLTLPSMSSQVSKLVDRGLVGRTVSPLDRRFVTLVLTAQGQQMLDAALSGAESLLAGDLARLSAEECATVVAAMEILRPIFSRPPSG